MPCATRARDAGFAQQAQVVGAGRRRHAECVRDLAADTWPAIREHPYEPEPHRVADDAHHRRQIQRGCGRMGDLLKLVAHAAALGAARARDAGADRVADSGGAARRLDA